MSEKTLKMIKDNDVKWVDLRFTDPRGKEQHTTFPAGVVTKDTIEEGFMFDGSSIAGWKAINESDMILLPDDETPVIDPFRDETTLNLRCDIIEPGTMQPYSRDPRSIAKAAEAYLKSSGIGDTAYFGPEAEFFIFDDVRWKVHMSGASYAISSEEAAWESNEGYESGNMGHRPRIKGGYFPVPPVDSAADIRNAMCSTMAAMGLPIEVHHHEVATACQNEIGVRFNTLVKKADELQIYKYVVHNVAHAYGKTATFMPKPLVGDNGSGMHVHQSISKGGKNLFHGDAYAGLSEIGAVLHRRHHQARALAERLHELQHQLVQAPGAGLRSAGVARVLRAQPFCVDPHSVHSGGESARLPNRSAVPGQHGESVPGVRGDDDGGPRRHQKQDSPRRSVRQGPLRPGTGRAGRRADRGVVTGTGARLLGRRPRIPEGRRRVHRRYDRLVHRAEASGCCIRQHDDASGGIRAVLQRLISTASRKPRVLTDSGFFYA